eukprot:8073360-Lingulodinium_polyedra.AAC.1
MPGWQNIGIIYVFDTEIDSDSEVPPMLADLPGSGSDDPVDASPDAEWWRFVDKGSAPYFTRGAQLRPLKVLSFCTGLCAESASLNKLGVQHELFCACDMK